MWSTEGHILVQPSLGGGGKPQFTAPTRAMISSDLSGLHPHSALLPASSPSTCLRLFASISGSSARTGVPLEKLCRDRTYMGRPRSMRRFAVKVCLPSLLPDCDSTLPIHIGFDWAILTEKLARSKTSPMDSLSMTSTSLLTVGNSIPHIQFSARAQGRWLTGVEELAGQTVLDWSFNG